MMLEELHVRDLALIEEAWLGFGPGMTVLTGETGAGKTVLLGALKLLLGERADSGAVRAGASEALVEGAFTTADSELLVKRRVGADGRSRCSVDGEMATVGGLAERVGPLVDLHGQHEHQALLATTSHTGYLDRWAGADCEALRSAYAAAWRAHREALASLAELERRVALAITDADRLAFTVEQIEAVDPSPGEDEELARRLPALQHAERLMEAAASAVLHLRGEEGALDRTAEAARVLAGVADIDPELDTLAARLTELEALVDDVSTAVREYRDRVEHDPRSLDELQERLGALTSLTRRYGPTLDDVLETLSRSRAALAAADAGEEALAAARAEVEATRAHLHESGTRLGEARRGVAPGFASALAVATSDLAMEGARFEVAFEPLDLDAWTAEGPDRIEFLYAPAPGQPARPLARIASGGELSRVMLALKGVLGTADRVGTLVFDEVDAGIGGATATVVGARLRLLAKTHQVIVVTHLAQVAAFADAHLVVRKLIAGDSATTTVAPVESEDRVAEVARMLSGSASETSLHHARELIEAARKVP